jgi:hypothetical protein
MEVWGLRLCVEAERRRQHRLGASGGISDNGEVGRALDLRGGGQRGGVRDLGNNCSNVLVVGKETMVPHG